MKLLISILFLFTIGSVTICATFDKKTIEKESLTSSEENHESDEDDLRDFEPLAFLHNSFTNLFGAEKEGYICISEIYTRLNSVHDNPPPEY
ncbi:MAG TPA: hypothetical protein VL125_15670 [Pelobium sp.]|nr:hypothetical protein [Pelobium sp.]